MSPYAYLPILRLISHRVRFRQMGVAASSGRHGIASNGAARVSGLDEEDGTAPLPSLWTYTLRDGITTHSMALHTARICGLPPSLLHRAEALLRLRRDGGGTAADPERTEACEVVALAREEERQRVNEMLGVVQSSHLDSARELLRTLVGERSGASPSPLGVITLPHGWLSPPRVAASSCVFYLPLHFMPHANPANNLTGPPHIF